MPAKRIHVRPKDPSRPRATRAPRPRTSTRPVVRADQRRSRAVEGPRQAPDTTAEREALDQALQPDRRPLRGARRGPSLHRPVPEPAARSDAVGVRCCSPAPRWRSSSRSWCWLLSPGHLPVDDGT